MEELEKNLFIPLKSEFYEQFEAGTKTDEFRKYGPRWNERTCHTGRLVTLSKGYGKQHRLLGMVTGFRKQHGTTFGEPHRLAIMKVFGTLDIDIAIIGIRTDPLPRSKTDA